jgi:hypothetical protein
MEDMASVDRRGKVFLGTCPKRKRAMPVAHKDQIRGQEASEKRGEREPIKKSQEPRWRSLRGVFLRKMRIGVDLGAGDNDDTIIFINNGKYFGVL